MQILGVANSYASAPVTAPTALSVSSNTNTTVTLAFTAPSNDGGSAITNYAYSTDGTNFTNLSPADAATPITITGLTANTSYTFYLAAVNIVGRGATSAGVAANTFPSATGGTGTDITVSGTSYRLLQFTSSGSLTVATGGLMDFVVVGGGGRPIGNSWGAQGYHRNDGAGGAGQALTYSAIDVPAGTYTVTIGGSQSQSNITTLTIPSQNSQTSLRASSGGNGGPWHGTGGANNGDLGTGSGGGGGLNGPFPSGGAGDPGVGASAGSAAAAHSYGGAGGGAGAAASTVTGGAGLDFGPFLGAGTTYLGGGGSSGSNGARAGGAGGGGAGGTSGSANTGGGGGSQRIDGAQDGTGAVGNGGSGIIYVRFRK